MKNTILNPLKGKATTIWPKPEEAASLVRSDKSRRKISEFRGLYPVMKGAAASEHNSADTVFLC